MKALYLLMFLFLFKIPLFGQPGPNGPGMLDIPKVVPPSPNAASLGRYGEVPVGLYTGIPNISIPLYTVSIGKFSFPISLSYYSSGLKVSELASQVGLGWSLNAGGVVTRSVNVMPDEVGYMAQGKWANIDSLIKHGSLVQQAVGGSLDLVPDNFSFNFAGRSGRFIIDASAQNKAHIIPFQPLQISYPSRLDSIQIIDENGIIYRFKETETSYTVGTVFENPYRSSWYLTQIITPYGNAEFTYAEDMDDVISEQSYELDYTKLEGFCDNIGNGQPPAIQVHANTKVLKSILTPSCKINFYSAANRRDAAYRSKLDSIVVLDLKGNRIRNFTLKYGYFGSETASSYKARRLKLDSLSEEGTTSVGRKWHTFEYFSPQSVPPTDSKSQDIWGYYNGQNNFVLLPALDTFIGGRRIILTGANRSLNVTQTMVGVLKKITYPTGGTTEFVYESNDYGYKRNAMVVAMEKKSSITTVAARSQAGKPTGITDMYEEFRIPVAQNVVLDYSGTNNSFTSPDGNPSVYLYKVEPNNSLTLLHQKGLVTTNFTLQMYLDTGLYRIRAVVDDYITELANIKASWYGWGDTLRSISVGGLRIREIITTDNFSPTPQVRKFIYKDIKDPRRSSGNLISDYSFTETKITDPSSTHCKFLIRNSFPAASLSTTHGSVVGYSCVTEINNDNKNGKKISEFSKGDANSHLQEYLGGPMDNYLSAVEGSKKYFSDFDYSRGNLLNETYFDSTGRTVSRTDVSYNFDSLMNGNYYFANVIYAYTFPTVNQVLCGQVDCSRLPAILGYRLIPSRIECPWVYETQRKETFYGMPGDSILTRITKSYYDNPAHAQLTRQIATKSDGKIETSYYKYPLDFSLPATVSDPDAIGIKYLQNNHIIGSIVEKYTLGANTSDISGTVISYNSNKPFPRMVWAFELDGTQNTYSPARINNGVFTKDSRYKQRITFDQYDSTGNILQQGKAFDAPTTYLWGYNNQYPVASIVGANYSAVAGIVSKDILRAPATPQALRDELNKLRTNLPTALVTTYTYVPLVGVSSETDPAGRTIYYEYDMLGRLKTIKDQDGKIVKLIEYQYRAPISQ